MHRRTCLVITLGALSMLTMSISPAAAQNVIGINTGWLPITDAERQMSAPKVDPSAGVEAIFWRVHLADEIQGGQTLQRVLHHYVRLKVFTEAGKEKATTVDIPFNQQVSIS